MQANLLHVVVPISNPILWTSRIRLYKDFEQHMLDSGVQLHVVECALGERPFQLNTNSHVNHIGVRHNTLCWHKESLANIGISRLPHDAKYIAVIDGDIEFRNTSWAYDTVHALNQYQVIQPWQHAYDLGPGPGGNHMQVHTSFASLVHSTKSIIAAPKSGDPYPYAHTGYAWAYTRQALELLGGLIDWAILGSADHHMAWGMIGRIVETIDRTISPEFMASLMTWGDRAYKHLGIDHIGFIPGTIEHHFHGAKDGGRGRQYQGRWQILRDFKYNPVTDLKRNTYGVVELAGNKPGLENAIDRYLRMRSEDANIA